MIGVYITFIAAVAIVVTYMLIVHSFLRAAEDPQDVERERKLRETSETRTAPSGRTQYAH